MCTLFIVLCFLWIFFLTAFRFTLSKLGQTRSLEKLQSMKGLAFYFPFHTVLFSKYDFDILFFAAQISTSIARVLLGLSSFYCLMQISFFPLWSLILIVLCGLLLYILIGDLIPRILSLRYSENMFLFSLPFSSFFLYLSFPVAIIFLKLSQKTIRNTEIIHNEDSELLKEKIIEILDTPHQKSFDAADKKLLESVLDFKDRIVREVMVPRVDLFSLPVETTIKEAAKSLIHEGYSRIPVFKDTVDNIIGVLMYKDILKLYMECESGKKDPHILDASIEAEIKKVFYTPETKKVSQLLQDFRNKQMHMAIVVDEYGGTEGIVTIEDILEEIVGEIADEYDIDEELLYTKLPNNKGWVVDARMSILDAEEIFDIEIPQEGEYDTIGGYVFHRVGSIPPKGLLIHHEDFDLEILESTERSVEKIRITPRITKKASDTEKK